VQAKKADKKKQLLKKQSRYHLSSRQKSENVIPVERQAIVVVPTETEAKGIVQHRPKLLPPTQTETLTDHV